MRAIATRIHAPCVVAHSTRSARRPNASRIAATPSNPSTKNADADDDDDFLSFLEQSMDARTSGARAEDSLNWGGDMTGEELRSMVLKRWGKLYDTRVCQRRDRFNTLQIYLQVMWKFVGQKSFPMTEAEYIAQTDAVAELLTEWDVSDLVRTELPKHPKVPKMDTTGANAVMIPLNLPDLENGVPGLRTADDA